MVSLKDLKIRIGSVSSTANITSAMKMISSAKVHKNEQALRRLLPFKNQLKSIMGHLLASGENFSSPLIEAREVKRIGIVVFGSDDGLCGAYNMNIFKQLLLEIDKMRNAYGKDTEFVLFPIGKKIAKPCRKIATGKISVEIIDGVDSKMEGEAVNNFTLSLQDRFLSGDIDQINVVYMMFRSISKQILTVDRLFPVEHQAIIGEAESGKADNKMYIFEPNRNRIFNEVLPMFVLSTMQEITIENRASEQAARVIAMQSASDNANKLLEELQLEYNKLRQQSITNELLDIVGGQVQK